MCVVCTIHVGQFESVGDFRALTLQLQASRISLEPQERGKIVVAVAMSDQALDQLMDKRSNGKGDLSLAGGGKSEIEGTRLSC